jgi:hypothetical protein
MHAGVTVVYAVITSILTLADMAVGIGYES